MNDRLDDYRERLNLALEGLVPIAWLDRLARCRDQRRPTSEELAPTLEEREAIVASLVMADGLAIGNPRARPGSLAALAKALAIGAGIPGGITFCGVTYEVVTSGGSMRLETRHAPRGGPS